jgi:F-type H+-transporting ATPase subunit b
MQFLIATIFIAQEEAETTSNVSLVLPETAELIAGIIAFAIVFFFTWRWAMPTIKKTLEARQEAVAGELAGAEKAKVEAESLVSDYKSQLAEAKTDANRIIEEAREAAESMRSDIVAKAEDEANQVLAKARTEAEAEKSRALAEARSQVGEISVDLAEKIVGESLDADAHSDLVERYLAELEQM